MFKSQKMPDGLGAASNIVIENEVAPFDDFYISYNPRSGGYGCETTALVLGEDIGVFFVLKGDHKTQYSELEDRNLQGCIRYFIDNINEAHRYSDHHALLKGTLKYADSDKIIKTIGQENFDKMKAVCL